MVKEEPEEEPYIKEEATDPEDNGEGPGEEEAEEDEDPSSRDSSSVTSSSSYISEGSHDTATEDETSSSAASDSQSSDGSGSEDASMSDGSDDVDSQLSDRSSASGGESPKPVRRRVKGRGRRTQLIDGQMTDVTAEAEADSAAQSSVWMLYHDSIPDKNLNRKAYAASVDVIGTVETEEDLEGFRDWIELDFVKDNFKYKRNLRIFRRGIMPMWEDEQNTHGGRLIFWYGPDCKKGIAVPVWRAFLGHLLRRTCDLRPVSGAVLHISAPRGICIDVWTNTVKLRKSWVQQMRTTVLPTAISVTFKPHKPLAPAAGTGERRAARKGMRSAQGDYLTNRKRPRETVDLVGAVPLETTPSGRQIVRPNRSRNQTADRENGSRRRPLQVAPPQSSVPNGRRPTWNDPPNVEDRPPQRRRRLEEGAAWPPAEDNGFGWDPPAGTRATVRRGEYQGGSNRRQFPSPHEDPRGQWQHSGRLSAGFRVVKRWE
eukprot:EG_transcript_6517